MVDSYQRTSKTSKRPPTTTDDEENGDDKSAQYVALWVSLLTLICLIVMGIAAFIIVRRMRKNEKKEVDRASTDTGTATKSTDQKKEFDAVERRMSLKNLASKNLPLEAIIIQQNTIKSHTSHGSTLKRTHRKGGAKEMETSSRSRQSRSRKSQKTDETKGRSMRSRQSSSKRSQKEKNGAVADETASSSPTAEIKKTSRYEKVSRRSSVLSQTSAKRPAFTKSVLKQSFKKFGSKSSKVQ